MENRVQYPTIKTETIDGRSYTLSLTGDSHNPIRIMVQCESGTVMASLFIASGKVYHISYGIAFGQPFPDKADAENINRICKTSKEDLRQFWIDWYINNKHNLQSLS